MLRIFLFLLSSLRGQWREERGSTRFEEVNMLQINIREGLQLCPWEGEWRGLRPLVSRLMETPATGLAADLCNFTEMVLQNTPELNLTVPSAAAIPEL